VTPRRHGGATLLAALAFAACSTSTTEPLFIGSVPCLPPGMRGDFFAWPVVALQPIELKNEDGEEAEARVVVYSRGREAVAVVWLGADIIAIDPHPETPDPDWVDESLVVNDELTVRTRPEAPCQWRRHKQGT
jgi:hypothetical protein